MACPPSNTTTLPSASGEYDRTRAWGVYAGPQEAATLVVGQSAGGSSAVGADPGRCDGGPSRFLLAHAARRGA